MAASEFWKAEYRWEFHGARGGLAVMPKRRPAPEISLSFLDVICCGFGAVILLLMITKTVEPQVLEESTVIAEGRVAELTEQLFEIRGEATVLNRDLAAKREQISEFEDRLPFYRLASVIEIAL